MGTSVASGGSSTGGSASTNVTSGAGGSGGSGGSLGSGGATTTGVSGAAGGTGELCDGAWVVYVRDFHESHPDMEKFGQTDHSAYSQDLGIVVQQLGPDQKPVFAMPTNTTTNSENFLQWYNDVDGVNAGFPQVLELDESPVDSGLWVYANSSFFPADGNGFDELSGTDAEGVDHNYHFTVEFHATFAYQQGQVFAFSGNDDAFVFINASLVIDLGGVHPVLQSAVALDELGLTPGEQYPLDLFYAQRHVTNSTFTIETSIEFVQCDTIIR